MNGKAISDTEYQERNPLQIMHRRMAWALSTATVAIIINTIAVVTLVDKC
jgi:hypothetical protein